MGKPEKIRPPKTKITKMIGGPSIDENNEIGIFRVMKKPNPFKSQNNSGGFGHSDNQNNPDEF